MSDPLPPDLLAANGRIDAMDVLRGFALLGILLMNIEGMVAPLQAAMTGVNPALAGADRWADAAVYVLVQGKFYPLFSMLFGMGFAVMMMRAEADGRAFLPVYLRRILALLAIGLAHALLVWSGDVLVSYALLAFPLMFLFRRTPVSRLPKWGIAFILAPSIFFVLIGSLVTMLMLTPAGAASMEAAMAEQGVAMAAELEAQRQAYGFGTWAEAVAQRREDLVQMLGYLVFMGWQILGLFLLGAWFVRSGAIARPEAFEPFYWKLRWVALPVGLAMVLASCAITPYMDFTRSDLPVTAAMGLFTLGGTLMALGYLAWILRGLRSSLAPRLMWLAPAGRMALTNYLLQSLVCSWIFSGWGLGYFEQLPRAWQVPFVVAFFAVQVVLSQAWLARFRMGPMEWLWRAATYLRLPPMRR
ncbi:DUF418 domain-containing protein [Arenimonas metalli]|uniref:DUF418 domain-containing protein n=1 Tax=Arenimonas metalli CF5-1 TaxID=1384056 RepID=A0A091ANF5_9GAMM|nr:DUF418 domain-containing protein [Arenimonas metalli]KFN41723.1 hypothetical protein N787_05490 [Arenimonas metalli CF5-1]